MTPLKIYGIARSRAFRTLWMAEELGLDYEHLPVGFADGGTKDPAFLAVNPMGRIPAIKDGDFAMWESLAINLYLAKKHDRGLYPKTLEDEARAWMWSFWALSELERPLLAVVLNRHIHPPEKRDAAAAAAAETEIQRPLAMLDHHLGHSTNLVRGVFTVADLNVAAVLYAAWFWKVDFSAWPHVGDWLTRCLERPAAKAARKLRE